jgi:hypothetical protein
MLAGMDTPVLTATDVPLYPYLYAPRLRPAGYGTLPSSLGRYWNFYEVPAELAENRPDRPVSQFRHGVICTPVQLNPREVEHFDLQPLENPFPDVERDVVEVSQTYYHLHRELVGEPVSVLDRADVKGRAYRRTARTYSRPSTGYAWLEIDADGVLRKGPSSWDSGD